MGAHMDDAYYGAGPILLRAVRDGHRVIIVTVVSDFSTWKPTIGREAQTRKDLFTLAKKWGFEQVFLDYAYHQVEPNVELKKKIATILQEAEADVVFVHNTDDHWPDHVAAGVAAKDAAIFRHGLSGHYDAPRTPLVFAYNLTPSQTIRFEPDTFINITEDMTDYMAMLADADHCLSGRTVKDLLWREITLLNRLYDNEPAGLRVTNHGWRRLVQCSMWGGRCHVPYALGLKTLWSRLEDKTRACEWFRRTWPNVM